MNTFRQNARSRNTLPRLRCAALLSLALAGAALAQTAPASSPAPAAATATAQPLSLRVYPNFSEVRQPVQAGGTTLTLPLPGGLIPGTLTLEGLRALQAVQQENEGWLSRLEGQTLTWTRDGQSRPVVLVRARDLLVRDAQGRFFYAELRELAFPSAPPLRSDEPQSRVTYTLAAAGSGTLSYLTRTLSWSPRYTLSASAGGAQLSALAEVRNDSASEVRVAGAELLAGQVPLLGDYGPQYHGVTTTTMARAEAMAADAAPPSVAELGELRGLYRYALTQPFVLAPNSVLSVPFTELRLTTFERYAGLQVGFSTQGSSGVMNRFYRLRVDRPVPGGILTVREDGRIVGQTALRETAAGEVIDFSLGRDPEVRYARNVQLVSREGPASGQVSVYRVGYAFENSKAQPVRAEVTERIGGRRVTVQGQPAAEGQASASLRVDVPAGGRATGSFTVTVDNRQ